MKFPITVTLSEPITHGDKTYSELIFDRYIKAKDLIAMDTQQGETRKDLALRASLCGVPLPVFTEMRASDLRKVREATVGLMGEWLGIPDAESPVTSPSNGE